MKRAREFLLEATFRDGRRPGMGAFAEQQLVARGARDHEQSEPYRLFWVAVGDLVRERAERLDKLVVKSFAAVVDAGGQRLGMSPGEQCHRTQQPRSFEVLVDHTGGDLAGRGILCYI